MTSAVRTNKFRRNAFTILEIVIALAVAALVMGGAIGMVAFSSDERALRNSSSQIEMLAKRAHTKAILDQIPYAIEFREGKASMLPFAQAGTSTSQAGDLPPEQVYQLPEDMQLSLLRWNTGTNWVTVKAKTIEIWRFDPEGLSEPLGIRLKINDSWQEDSYHPLTASIQSTESEIR